MTAEATRPTPADTASAPAAAAAPAGREKTAIPKNPGRRDLGMKATLLFPNKEIVEQYYVPLIYTACRTCYSELTPEDIFDRATTGRIEQAKMQKLISGVIESGSVTSAICGPTSSAHSSMMPACWTRFVSPDCLK